MYKNTIYLHENNSDSLFYDLALNQFLGFNRTLYLLKNFFPTSNAPTQNVISPITKSIAEKVTLAPFPIDKNGMTAMARNARTHTMRSNIPHLKYRFCFILNEFNFQWIF